MAKKIILNMIILICASGVFFLLPPFLLKIMRMKKKNGRTGFFIGEIKMIHEGNHTISLAFKLHAIFMVAHAAKQRFIEWKDSLAIGCM